MKMKKKSKPWKAGLWEPLNPSLKQLIKVKEQKEVQNTVKENKDVSSVQVE
jgi:hypothetical protein